MSRELDFSLPKAARERRGGRFVQWLTFLAAGASLAMLVLIYTEVRRNGSATPQDAGAASSPYDPAVLEKLGESLERRTLYLQAADVWAEYLARAGLEGTEAADILYRRAKNLHEAGQYAEAARLLTQVEALDVPREDRRRAVSLLSECLSALGKEEVREKVLSAYTIPGREEEGTVVARVGGDPITLEDLRREVRRQVLAVLKLRGEIFDQAELEQKADEMARAELEKPEVRRQVLQQLVQEEVLYREALSRNLAARPEYVEALQGFRRGWLAARLVEDAVEGSLQAIGPTDLRNHYDAHREDYVEKPSVDFSYQRFESADAAEAALRNPVDGDFVPGDGPAVPGEAIPGIGRSAEATAHLLALEEGRVGERVIRVGDAWYLFRSDKRHEKRQKSFEEAVDEVRTDLARAKRAEAAKKLQETLARKFNVEIIDASLTETDGDPEAGGAEEEEGDGSSSPESGSEK